jgi:hypothetical protein
LATENTEGTEKTTGRDAEIRDARKAAEPTWPLRGQIEKKKARVTARTRHPRFLLFNLLASSVGSVCSVIL